MRRAPERMRQSRGARTVAARDEPQGATPPRNAATHAYVFLVCLAALVLLIFGWDLAAAPTDPIALVVLGVLGFLSWAGRERDAASKSQLSFISIILLTSAVIAGPVGAGAVGLLSAGLQWGRTPFEVRAFNAAMFSCVGSIGGISYLLAGGATDVGSLHSPGALIIEVGLPAMVADVAQCLANAILLSGVIRASVGAPFRTQVWGLLTTSGPAYVGYGIIGFLFVVLWVPAGVGWFSAVLILAPLLVARFAFVQYVDEQRAHDRTLSALVAAVEAKDPQSVGHSARVAQLCTWIGEAMSLGHKDIAEVRTAGMLHDLGKLAVPSRILRARRELTDDELITLADHPLVAVDMLAGISFMSASLEGIAHHHERFDGLGYPDGLTGDDIPLAARIIAAADAMDALTTNRPYRPAMGVQAALAVMHSRSGDQFDPRVVVALDRVMARHPWEPLVRSADFWPFDEAATDHDDPEASDRLAVSPLLLEELRQRATARHSRPMPRAGATL